MIWQEIFFLKKLVDNQAEEKNREYFTPISSLRKDKGGSKGQGLLAESTLGTIEEKFKEILKHEKNVGIRIIPKYYQIVRTFLYDVLQLNSQNPVTANNINESQILELMFNKTITLFAQKLTETFQYPTIIPAQISETAPASWITLELAFDAVFNESQRTGQGVRYDEIIRKIAEKIIGSEITPEKAKELKLTTEKYSKTLKNLMSKYALLSSRGRGNTKFKMGIFEETSQVVKIRDCYWEDANTIQQFLNYFKASHLSLNFPTLFKQCVLWEKNPSKLETNGEIELPELTPDNIESFDFSRLTIVDANPHEESFSSQPEIGFFDNPDFLSFLNEYSVGQTFQAKESNKAEVFNEDDDLVIKNDEQYLRDFFDAIDQGKLAYISELTKANLINPNLTREQVGSNYNKETAKDTALFAILQIPKSSYTEEILSALLKLKITNINQENFDEDTLLEMLIKNEYYELAKELIERGAVIERPEISTALHVAASKGNNEIIQLLLERRANVNAAGPFGDTPLHMAVSGRHANTVDLLLQNGADPEKENHDDMTPIDWAKGEHRNEEILALLTEDQVENPQAVQSPLGL